MRLRDGSVLSGTLLPGKIRLGLLLGRSVTVAPRELLWLHRPGLAARPSAGTLVILRGGDVLLGRLAQEKLTVRTKSGVVSLAVPDVLAVDFDGGDGRATVKTWEGKVVRGRLVGAGVSVAISGGRAMLKPRADRIVSIDRSSLPPPDLAGRVEKIISNLGHRSPAVREAATQVLTGMGPPVAEILRKHKDHPDLEIRLRVREILKKLGARTCKRKGIAFESDTRYTPKSPRGPSTWA